MKTELLKVAFRKNAIVIPDEWIMSNENVQLNETTSVLLANCSKLGFTFSEDLLKMINRISPNAKAELLELLKEISGVNKNWTPLVKQWDIPTGESVVDHLITWFANILQSSKGDKLPCGHIIPKNTFPLERYNGCPYCGAQFEYEKLTYEPNLNKLTVLSLWSEIELERYLVNLIESPVALDATQIDDLKILVDHFGVDNIPDVKIKETLMIIIDALVARNKFEVASKYFKTPHDILRYLWFKHTGFLQIIEPRTIVKRITKNANNLNLHLDNSKETKLKALADLKLKFNRVECKQYAFWLNNLTMNIAAQCENMHPKRSIWVRVIRALRLAEYSKKDGFEQLAKLLDTFYNQNYEVWQAKVNSHRFKTDEIGTFVLLKQRPGLFARSLFSTMLWFGPEITIKHFKEVLDQVPARLIFTLNMYAEVYFDKGAMRTVKPLGGVNKKIATNKLLQLYSDEALLEMQSLIKGLTLEVIKSNFGQEQNQNATMFIDDGLYNIPIAIGDRNEHIQDLNGALMGTRFKVEGDTIRLFLQWGEGLEAQHLDMDLSCSILYNGRTEFCSFSQLVIPGCKHSGDIQRIPNKVGTAEYIDLNINELQKLGAQYVSFTCNAFTSGSLWPNLVVGWMNSKYPMRVSANGIAYNPTNVQHQVRIKQSLSKGMVFGVLEIATREIVWLELSFEGQIVQNMNFSTVQGMLAKLNAKLKIGDLLQLKAEVQGLTIVDDIELADEVYDMKWAMNTAEVSKLFL